ncbi:thioredoxin, mitochondrial [Periplaneta americana]|uniref:thioredoxin, mitochondrial n=1 Tax=Periplaneta americana TaxID=6978 RepID=UPI0037E896CD
MQSSVILKGVMLRNVVKETCKSAVATNSVRCIGTSALRHDSFKIQDHKDFQERVKNSKVPVIVDFFATWCNPCRMLTPRLESVIAEKKGEVILAKVDIDENTDLALDYEVGSVPVLIAIKNGKVEERLVGLQDTDKLRKFVEKVVAGN